MFDPAKQIRSWESFGELGAEPAYHSPCWANVVIIGFAQASLPAHAIKPSVNAKINFFKTAYGFAHPWDKPTKDWSVCSCVSGGSCPQPVLAQSIISALYQRRVCPPVGRRTMYRGVFTGSHLREILRKDEPPKLPPTGRSGAPGLDHLRTAFSSKSDPSSGCVTIGLPVHEAPEPLPQATHLIRGLVQSAWKEGFCNEDVLLHGGTDQFYNRSGA